MAKKSKDFETMLNELELIVNTLDTEEPSLEESFKLYEKGVKLVRDAESVLHVIETKVEALHEKEADELHAES